MLDTLVLTSLLGIFIMVLEMLKARHYIIPITVVALIGILLNHNFGTNASDSFGNMLATKDPLSKSFISILIAIGIVIVTMSYQHYKQGQRLSDFMILKVFILAGAIAMVYFQNLIVFFIGLEILSIGLYTLSTSDKKNILSNEAGMKYFITGSFATAVFLLGLTLIYAHTGTFDLVTMHERMQVISADMSLLVQVGLFLMIVALLFKTSAVPFHLWSPDVYQGSPIMTTALLATLSKIAAIGALFRLSYYGLHFFIDAYPSVLIIASCLSMLVGSIAALKQTNFKRIMAFSGITNAGFMLIPVLYSHHENAISAIMMYAISYALGSLAVFAVAIGLVTKGEDENIKMFDGLAKKYPISALSVTIGLLSIMGIPPLIGFFAKYNVIVLAMNNLVLAVVAVISSAISVYVYFRIIWAMYLKESHENQSLRWNKSSIAIICAVALVLLSVFSGVIFFK